MSDQTAEQPPLPADLASPKAAKARMDQLEAENAGLRAQLAGRSAPPAGPAPDGKIRMRITSAHQTMQHGGVTIGQDWTEVPASYQSRLFEAAQESGVELEQEA